MAATRTVRRRTDAGIRATNPGGRHQHGCRPVADRSAHRPGQRGRDQAVGENLLDGHREPVLRTGIVHRVVVILPPQSRAARGRSPAVHMVQRLCGVGVHEDGATGTGQNCCPMPASRSV